ncbi:UDP-N-acetylmuramate--L-alanine ligase [bacterium 3DAC]|nr:UDP-N-acetylmuramate--L-alanine ligase [bacterium 3DAC]
MRFPIEKKLHVHFIGIGGIGMSALAYALAEMGHDVSGSDIREDFYTRSFLESVGVKIYTGHSPSHVAGSIDLGVVSTAISPANPEFREFLRKNIPIVHRSQILGAFTKANTTIGITGAHGKTTLTYYIAKILLDAFIDPSIIIGSTMSELSGNNVRVGGELLVAEIDESDKSLLNTYPDYPVIHSIDIEHMDHYSSYEDIYDTFLQYGAKTPWWGYTFINVNYDDLYNMAVSLDNKGVHVIKYGFADSGKEADYVGFLGDGKLTVVKGGSRLTSFTLRYPTKYNFENALAAFVVTHMLGVAPAVIASALEDAGMPGRRLEYKGAWHGATVLEDYAHHPREIKALLDGVRQMYPGAQVWGVIQPHRYSRVKALWDDFRDVISQFDKAFVMPIYPASEKPIEGITTENLIEGIDSAFYSTWDNIVSNLMQAKHDTNGKVVIVLIGAGDVYKVWKLLSNE